MPSSQTTRPAKSENMGSESTEEIRMDGGCDAETTENTIMAKACIRREHFCLFLSTLSFCWDLIPIGLGTRGSF